MLSGLGICQHHHLQQRLKRSKRRVISTWIHYWRSYLIQVRNAIIRKRWILKMRILVRNYQKGHPRGQYYQSRHHQPKPQNLNVEEAPSSEDDVGQSQHREKGHMNLECIRTRSWFAENMKAYRELLARKKGLIDAPPYLPNAIAWCLMRIFVARAIMSCVLAQFSSTRVLNKGSWDRFWNIDRQVFHRRRLPWRWIWHVVAQRFLSARLTTNEAVVRFRLCNPFTCLLHEDGVVVLISVFQFFFFLHGSNLWQHST